MIKMDEFKNENEWNQNNEPEVISEMHNQNTMQYENRQMYDPNPNMYANYQQINPRPVDNGYYQQNVHPQGYPNLDQLNRPTYNYSGAQQYSLPVQPSAPKKHSGLKIFGVIAAVMALAVLFQATAISVEPFLRNIIQGETNTENTIRSVSPFTQVTANGETSSETVVSDVSAQVGPAIVSITVTVAQRDFFNNTTESEGSGSGIIFTQDEEYIYILTNQHVISDSSKVSVTFIDGKTYDATIKGSDVEADLAIVLVKLSDVEKDTKNKIKVAVFGNSDNVIQGEVAIAIGSPLGYSNTVTAGYISSVGRTVELTDKTMELIQTDAAINPGNSGGALINAKGEIIGINTIKFATTDVEGMGFAIPINIAKTVIEEILNRVPQAFLGIRGQDITEQLAQENDMLIGVYVVESVIGSPADIGGIVQGDIIYQLNDEEVATMEDLQGILGKLKPGEGVTVSVYRKTQGEYKPVEVNILLGTKQN
jgi:serine protease Do